MDWRTFVKRKVIEGVDGALQNANVEVVLRSTD